MNDAWLQGLRERLDAPPRRPRAPLCLANADRAGAVVVGSIESALARRLADAGLAMRRAGDVWQIEVPATAAVDPALAALARWLHSNGQAAAWRGELLPVVDAAGDTVGAIERAAVRPLGIATHAVHLVVHDPRGHVWVQQRAFDKATDPGLWDTTVGGLMAVGESVAQTLERESWEEAGLRIVELTSVTAPGRITVRRPLDKGYMVEHIEMFEAVAPEGLAPLNQDGEVERFECVDRAALVERLHADAFTLEAAMILARWLERRAVD